MAETKQLGPMTPDYSRGVTQNDLVRIFNVTATDVKARLQAAGVRPTGHKTLTGHPLWSIKDAAPHLIKQPADIVEKILRMHHNDLPKMLSKEFWYGQNQKLNYDERVGDLWKTKDVVTLCGDAFKTLRLSLMLLSDAVEREVGLTVQQRDIISRLVTTALYEMQGKLVDGFEQRRTGTFGKPGAREEDDPAAGL